MGSKRHIRRKSCEGKVRHLNYGAAYGAYFSLLRKNQVGQNLIHVYHCQFCNGFHIGHQSVFHGAGGLRAH
jgi:hypothetical protein